MSQPARPLSAATRLHEVLAIARFHTERRRRRLPRMADAELNRHGWSRDEEALRRLSLLAHTSHSITDYVLRAWLATRV